MSSNIGKAPQQEKVDYTFDTTAYNTDVDTSQPTHDELRLGMEKIKEQLYLNNNVQGIAYACVTLRSEVACTLRSKIIKNGHNAKYIELFTFEHPVANYNKENHCMDTLLVLAFSPFALAKAKLQLPSGMV